MTCAPHIRADAGWIPPRPTRVRLALADVDAPRTARLTLRSLTFPPIVLRPACACRADRRAMPDMLDRKQRPAPEPPPGLQGSQPPEDTPILLGMSTQLDSALTAASLSEAEHRTLRRFVASLLEALGPDLYAIWLYGSRARGERRHPDSDVDLLVITEGDVEANQRLALDLSEAAALAEGESPFSYSVHVYEPSWLHRRREIESFFVQEVDRDKVVLAGSALEGREAP